MKSSEHGWINFSLETLRRNCNSMFWRPLPNVKASSQNCKLTKPKLPKATNLLPIAFLSLGGTGTRVGKYFSNARRQLASAATKLRERIPKEGKWVPN